MYKKIKTLGIIFLLALLTGCMSQSKAMEAIKLTLLDAVVLQVFVNTIDETHQIYSGESINLTVRIENYRNYWVQIDNIAIYGARGDILFNTVNAVKLTSPSGKNLLQNHFTVDSFPPGFKTLNIRPNGTEFLRFDPHLLFVLDEVGQYSFSAQFIDMKGEVYQSQEVYFEVIPIPTTCPLNDVTLTVDIQPRQLKLANKWDVATQLTFENLSDQPLIFYDVTDNLNVSWLNPITHFQIQNQQNHFLRPGIHQDITGDPTILPNYKEFEHLLLPGEKITLTVPFSFYYGRLKEPGLYTLQLSYVAWPRYFTNVPIPFPKEACLGVIKAEPITFEILPENE